MRRCLRARLCQSSPPFDPIRFRLGRLAEPQAQDGHDEQVQQGRRGQPAPDHDGHRMLDLAPRTVAASQDRKPGERRGRRSHQNRDYPLLSPAQNHFTAAGCAFLLLQMARD
jgi:hypothetical protein